MGLRKHANRAAAPLAAGITNSATSLTLATGKGALFPSLGAGEFFMAVIQKGALDTDQREYVKVTARSGDSLTVTRGQEGSPAQDFAAGDVVAAVVTAGHLDGMVQSEELPPGVLATILTGLSTATNAAITAADTVLQAFEKLQAQITSLGSTKADLESPDLTGNPTAPTQSTGDDSTRLATTAWVRSAMSNIASAAGFVISLGSTSSYVKFPSWLGSWLIQFGTTVGTTGGSGNITVTFPIAFVNNMASVASNGDANTGNEPTTIANSNATGMNVLFVGLGSGVMRRANWIAVGN